MKKILLCLSVIASFTGYSQTSIQVSNQGPVVAANGTIAAVTTASSNTKVYLDIKNTSNSTKSYNVKRYDVLLHTAGTSTANAYFCFAGSCWGSSTYSAGLLTLGAGQSASQSTTAFNMLITDLDEANTVGHSVVKYTFINASMQSDSVQVTIDYNGAPTGINEINNLISSFELSPNPVNETATIKINCVKAIDCKFCIYNALGALVNEKYISLSEGKNKLDFSAETLSSGIYFANLKFGNVSSTKKFIVR